LLATHRSIWARHIRNHPSAVQQIEVVKTVGDEFGRFELIPAERLLGTQPKPREYVVENFLPRKIVAGLFAPGGAGKSTFTLATAVSVSSASPLFGVYSVGRPGKVVLISGEDDREEIQRRLHRLTGSLTECERRLVGRNLHVLDLADAFELFTEKPAHGEVLLTGVPEAIASSIESSVGSVDLIIVDPASRFRGGEENSAGDTTRFVQALQYLRDRLGACVWVIHHVSKAARGTSANSNNARGSSALIDGLRLGYELTVLDRSEAVKLFGDAAGEGDLLTLRCVKSNYGKAPEPIFLRRNGDGTLSKFDEKTGDVRDKKLLAKIHEAGLTKSQFRDRFAGVSGEFGLSEKSLVKAIESLVSAGLVDAPDRARMRLTEQGRLRLGLGDRMDSQRASNGQQDGSKPA
jgi:RecA-family ATPase